ncbi:MAG: DUF4265 domain-containing protein [Imperialibacter sp.]|uniref:DUF4265 domain-containing protein n=1 Tax=Imperialibacter sp. TaxID=2038411 RepID=UPI0032EB2DE9
MAEDGLVKLHIDLPNHWGTGGESMWAEPLGNDLYRIENVLFYAYGLNYQDIVRATADSEDLKPEVRELVTDAGHRTFRVIFERTLDKAEQETILDSLNGLGITYERATQSYVALDMEPSGDYQATMDQLAKYEEQGLLEFETCEARVEGSFDDRPDEEDDEKRA